MGTALAVGAGSVEHGISGGALGGVYKLVWYDADADRTADPTEAPIKVAGPKSTWPGRKQVSRIGVFREDVIHLEDEAPLPDGRSLLEPVLRGGELIPGVLPSLNEIRDRAAPTSPPSHPNTAPSKTRPSTWSAPQIASAKCATEPCSSTATGSRVEGTIECSGLPWQTRT